MSPLRAIPAVIPAAIRAAVDAVLPARCPGCGAVTGADHRFCAACWGSLRFLRRPWCAGCNLPFAFDRGDGAVCAPCAAAPPRHGGVRAAVAYGAVARTLALRLKYGGRTAFAETAARLMVPLMPGGAEVIVPVPLHRRRLWSRGFNQTALIGEGIAQASGVPQARDALIRTRSTPVLRGMGRRERARIVAGAFAMARPEAVRGRHVVLVDDVHTSGATTGACTDVLLRAGATRVTILCWARVLDAGGDPDGTAD